MFRLKKKRIIVRVHFPFIKEIRPRPWLNQFAKRGLTSIIKHLRCIYTEIAIVAYTAWDFENQSGEIVWKGTTVRHNNTHSLVSLLIITQLRIRN